MDGFRKLTNYEETKLIGGFSPALIAFIPLGIQIFNSLIAGIKALVSPKGEIKDKLTSYKWES